MAVAAEPAPRIEPDLDGARELARDANVIPVSYRFVDDCETPVSAFLKLREAFPGPSFLLESAEQGRLGRYSFLGFRPRVELRWTDGTLTEVRDGEVVEQRRRRPLRGGRRALARFEVAAPPERLPPFAGGAVGFFGYDLVRTVEPLGRAEPRPARAARHVADGLRADARLRPPAPRGDRARLRVLRRRRRRSTPPTTARSA